ncbi:MAG: hypothetical protein AAGI44_09120 [Pseudomonadota bacterium]
MFISIWRHGEAGRASSDRQRELTSRGEEDVASGARKVASAYKLQSIAPPELILFSPWLRTTQTARLIGTVFEQAKQQEEPALRPGSSTSTVDRLLVSLQVSQPELAHIVLVSHQPLVSELARYYLSPDEQPPSLVPGALCVCQFDAVAKQFGELVFSAAPPDYDVVR